MDETKRDETVYSSERAHTATAERKAEAREIAESFRNSKAAASSKQTQQAQMTDLPRATTRGESSAITEFAEFLKQTKRVWLTVAGIIFGLLAMVTLVKRVSEWAANARERRLERAVASVTPERLIARCGQPVEDVTREVYPILMRTMSYQPRGNEKLVIVFSRTAEEKSDWVFLSMKDEGASRSYDTPDAKVAALPCLDSKK
jgi:hypothetical protein